jgi:hypothetical protein
MKLSFHNCSSGAVGVLTALTVPVLIGFASLGVEVGHWYSMQRVMQGAADAAAISATAQYVKDYNAGNQTSTTYKNVGVNYARLNGFTIPTANVCLIDPNGADGCGSVEALDTRPVICQSPPCVVVEITQNTADWLSTQASLEPNPQGGGLQAIPTPTLLARAVVSAKSQLVATPGGDCVLALANDPQAIFIHGNGDPQASCGFVIDGGRDQNAGNPIQGGITFSGWHAKVNIHSLTVAATTANCPDDGTHCQQFGSTAPLTAVTKGVATPDPYAPQIASLFQTPPPAGANAIAIAFAGAGYTGGTCTFTVTGGTFYSATAGTPAKFTATIPTNGPNKGKVTTPVLVDPGAYASFPTGTVSATSNCDAPGKTAATFTLTEGCYTWKGTAIAGRKYCSINLNGSGTTNFPAGNYWIAGGDACVGFCVSSANATVTSDNAGVTFFLTNGEGTGTFGTGSYASINITSGNVSLCAPGTNCGTSCAASGPTACMLFLQNPAATISTALNTPQGTGGTTSPNTVNSFAGNGSRTLAGLIYLPKQTFAESGNGPIAGCVAVIAKYFDIGGTPTFSDGCLPGNGIGSTVTTSLSNPHLSQ